MVSESVNEHRADAPTQVGCAVVTVSDTRTTDSDRSGKLMQERLTAAGHSIVSYAIVRDEPDQIRELLDRYTSEPECHAIIFNGGTGISHRDTTYDVISSLLEKTLPGFGELFRMLSWDEIGPAAMLSRATAGIYMNRLIISTPGSTNAVRLAMEKLIVPEIGHLVYEMKK